MKEQQFMERGEKEPPVRKRGRPRKMEKRGDNFPETEKATNEKAQTNLPIPPQNIKQHIEHCSCCGRRKIIIEIHL
jgi:hypothetical protein